MLTFYIVVNEEGLYMVNKAQAKRYWKDCWTSNVKKAKVYDKPGPAKSQISYLHKTFTDKVIPKLGELVLAEVKLTDISEEIKNNKAKRDLVKHQQEEDYKKYQLESIDRKLKELAEQKKKILKQQ
jgi:hypothetical protein